MPDQALSRGALARYRFCRGGLAVAALAALFVFPAARVNAEPLREALVRAYEKNPLLNAQRSSVLAVSENIERTKAGYRPRVTGAVDAGLLGEDYKAPPNDMLATLSRAPRGASVEINQNLFDGYRTTNAVGQAKLQTLAAKAILKNTEQITLFTAATAYLEVLTDHAILKIVRDNIDTLQAQLSQAKGRHGFGDVTGTEVAQVQMRLAAAQAQASLAESNVKAGAANYRRVIGVAPSNVVPVRPLDELVPSSLEELETLATRDHPAVVAAQHGVAVAERQVNITRGELLPSLTVTGRLAQRADVLVRGDRQLQSTVFGAISVPIYEGGETYARLRQAKHTAAQRDLEASAVIDEMRSTAAAAWATLIAAKERLASAELQVRSAETVRDGLREEWRMGDRSMRELLDAEQDVLLARINLATTKRERVLASFSVVQSAGRLTMASLRRLELNISDVAMRSSLRSHSGLGNFKLRLTSSCAGTCALPVERWRLRSGL